MLLAACSPLARTLVNAPARTQKQRRERRHKASECINQVAVARLCSAFCILAVV